MSETNEGERSAPSAPTALVYLLFFVSGGAALLSEASWSRQVGLAVGNTAQAAALVLAALFVGLAAGQFLGGLLSHRVRPMLGYGVAELLAATWACSVPGLLAWVPSVGQSAWCFLVLLPATVPLGTTLPFVVQALGSETNSARVRGSWAYGVNTAGGLVGIVLATAILLSTFGVRASGFLAAGLSAACGLVACGAAVLHGESAGRSEPQRVEAGSPTSAVWLAVAAISGFGALGLEVLYTRMFALVFHNSTYTFGAVVTVFLLALCLGVALATWLGRRCPPWDMATAAFSLGSVVLAASVAAFPHITGLHYFSTGETFAGYLAGAFCLVAAFVLPPVTLLGMALPAALQAARGGGEVGRVAAVNALAATAGALAAGFLLPSWLGLWASLGLVVVLLSLAGVVMLVVERRWAVAAGVLMAGCMSAALVTGLAPPAHDAGVELVRRWESEYGWVDVVRLRKDGSFQVRQNLHYRHGSTAEAVREYRQGRLPLLLHPAPKEVAFLGLGTGLTAAPAVVDRGVERAVVVELIPEVVEASRLLASANLGVADHPKIEVRLDDARHYLARTEERFDVVVSDLFVPWEGRSGYLYTVEFYQSVRGRLKPGGLFCQWLALYQVGPEQLALIADSFASVFPNTTVWWGQLDGRYPIVALIGSEGLLPLDHQRLKDRLDAQTGLPGGADPDLRHAGDVPVLYAGAWERNASRRLNTDEHPWLEFTAPISHRSGRTLHGSGLQKYFDEALSKLSPGGVEADGELGDLIRDGVRRRALQRLSLFSEIAP